MLSIVVPAFNEEQRLPGTLRSLLDFAADRDEQTEIIVVDDGSTDGTAGVTSAVGGDDVKLIRTPSNMGKGHAVRTGILAASGTRRLFTDADGSTPIGQYEVLEEALHRAGGSGVAFGSIGIGGADVQRPQRGIRPALGKLGNLIIRAVALPGVKDSQRGFKLFSADAAEDVFGLSVIDRWGFDVEVLALARRLGYRCVEVPIEWAHVPGGTLTPTAYATTLADVARVGWRLMRGAYELKKTVHTP